MRIEQSYFQKAKALFHAFQGLFTFVAGCLALAVLTKSGNHGGQLGFYFALCFFTIPALIYQVMVPMWTRAWRFANVYAYLGIDLLFSLLWFAATVALGVWQAQGVKQGRADHADDEDVDDKGDCEIWAFGSSSKCKVTKAGVGFGVVILLLWCLTSAISVWMVNKYRKTGVVPGSKNAGRGAFHQQQEFDDQASKDAWSTRIDEPEDLDDAADDRRKYGQLQEYDEHEHEHEHGSNGGEGFLRSDSRQDALDAHPGRRSPMDSDARSTAPSGYEDGMAPSALSPTGVLSPTYGQLNPFANQSTAYDPQTGSGRVQFPPGNY